MALKVHDVLAVCSTLWSLGSNLLSHFEAELLTDSCMSPSYSLIIYSTHFKPEMRLLMFSNIFY